ncbi:tetratricopeptide repeat protein [Rhizobiaceae bacterium]|nr:tetratricopeptide repeat protein [Rhizobiaceae bacterium]
MIASTLRMLALGTLMVTTSAFAEQEPASEVSDSLAGNYLAARVAATDRDTEAASAFYRKALALDPENDDLRLQAFLIYLANGEFEDAVELGGALQPLETSPEIVDIVLALSELKSKDWKGAERNLDKNWESALDRLLAGLIEGWARFGAGDVAGALEIIDGLDGPAWFDLFVQYHGGLIALAGGDAQDAVTRLELAYTNQAGAQAAGETWMRVVSALVQARIKAGDIDGGKELVATMLERQPQNPVIQRLDTMLAAGEPLPVAVQSARRGSSEVLLNIATAINRDGGQNFARIYMQLARELSPNDDLVIASLADLLDQQGLLEKANVLFDSVPDTSVYASIARLEKALNLDEMGKEEEARAALEALTAETPDDLIANMSYGAVLARHEKYADAAVVYEAMTQRIGEPQPVHWNLFYRLGISYERTKQWPKAEAAFRKALELNPDQPSVLNYLGYSWIDMDTNLQEGLDMIRKAVSLRPNDGYIVDSLGWAYYRLKRYQEAVKELERAVELRPGDATINDHLGDAYWRANRRLEATFQWRHALALDPEEKDIAAIRKKLAEGMPDPSETVAEPDRNQQPDEADDDKKG